MNISDLYTLAQLARTSYVDFRGMLSATGKDLAQRAESDSDAKRESMGSDSLLSHLT